MKPKRLARERLAGRVWLGQDAERAGAHGAFMPLVLGGEVPEGTVEVYATDEWIMGNIQINGMPTFHRVGFLNKRQYRRFRAWVSWMVFLTGDWSERWQLVAGPWHRWRQRRAIRRYKRRMEKQFPGMSFDSPNTRGWQ